MSIKVLLLLAVFCLVAYTQKDGATLKKVVVLFRHGARYPNYISNAPIYNTELTKQFSGQLSPVGARQLFQLGTKLREEYITNKKFLQDSYDYNQLYIRSTDSDRTIMSAQSFMAGLYPAGTGPKVDSAFLSNPDLKRHLNPPYVNLPEQPNDVNSVQNQYQPVPIRTVQNQYDGALYIHGNACKNYAKWRDDAANGQLFTKYRQFFDKEFQDFETIFKDYNFKAKGSSLSALYEWLDVLQCNLWNNFPEQDSASKSFYGNEEFSKKIKTVVGLQFYLNFFLTEQQRKVIPTPFFQDLLKYTSDNYKQRFTILSGHDTTINTVLQGLNLVSYDCLIEYIENGYQPKQGKVCIVEETDFAANIVFEVVNQDGKDYIQVKYNGIYQKICDQTQTYCEMTDFKKRINSQIVIDYDIQCGNVVPQTQTQEAASSSDDSAPGWSIALIVIFGVLFGIAIVLAFYSYKMSNRAKQYMSAKQEQPITTI